MIKWLTVLLFFTSLVYASGDKECVGKINCNEVDIGGDARARGGDAEANAASTAEGGQGGSSSVTTNNEHTSLVLTGARDTAACFTKVTIGAEGFGIGFSRSDPYCKKIRLIAAQHEKGNHDAAVKLECTLSEWKEVFGKDYGACFQALSVEPDLINQLYGFEDVDSLHAQVSKEEYEEEQELIQYRIEQQQNLIQSLQEEHDEKDAEIERLKREAAELRRTREVEEQEEAIKAAKFQAILQKREESDDEPEGND